MPIHDWTRVKAGIFHDFHHSWIEEIKRALNGGLLPEGYYALAEQQAAGYGPDVLTLQSKESILDSSDGDVSDSAGTATLARPRAKFTFTTDAEFYRRKKSSIVIRHVSDDQIVAMIEIVSPGNKSSRNAIRAFLEKTCFLLEQRIHLLIVDLFPPAKRDPHGIHAAIWGELKDEAEAVILPPDKPLTLVAYESGLEITAFVEPVAVGDRLPDMPLILEHDGAVEVPLESTYQAAFAALPGRWRQVLGSGVD